MYLFYEYKVDTLIMKYRHWHWLEPQEGTKRYTVFTTELKMWSIDGDRKVLVDFLVLNEIADELHDSRMIIIDTISRE